MVLLLLVLVLVVLLLLWRRLVPILLLLWSLGGALDRVVLKLVVEHDQISSCQKSQHKDDHEFEIGYADHFYCGITPQTTSVGHRTPPPIRMVVVAVVAVVFVVQY